MTLLLYMPSLRYFLRVEQSRELLALFFSLIGRLSKDNKSNNRDIGSSLGGNKGNEDIN
jgi:hypothetical protein